jgi:hypothetical protein
LTSIKVPK